RGFPSPPVSTCRSPERLRDATSGCILLGTPSPRNSEYSLPQRMALYRAPAFARARLAGEGGCSIARAYGICRIAQRGHSDSRIGRRRALKNPHPDPPPLPSAGEGAQRVFVA